MALEYLHDDVVVKEAQRRWQAPLPITWEGNQYNPMPAWAVLLGGAGMGASMAAVCREGRAAPSDNLVRATLNEQGWDERLSETAGNDLLAHSARQYPWKGCCPVGIDLPEEPLYGQLPEEDPEGIRRSAAKVGPPSFHTFATADVMRRQRRLTLAAPRGRAHQSMLEVAERLRQRVEALGIAVQVYGLDRQLWPYELQGAWQAVPYSMPWRRTGQTGSQGGTRPLFELPASPFATYTMRADPQASIDIDVAGVVVPETQEARQKRRARARAAYERARKRVEEQAHVLDEDSTARNKRAVTCAKKALAKAQSRLEQARSAKPLTTLCYAINQVTHWSLKRIYWAYRGRLGIESSSRQSRQARLFTTRRQAWFRLLSFGLSMILRNLWLAVRWLLGEPKRGRGGRKIAKTLLPFPMFLRWLVSALWKALRFTTWISPQAELPNPLWGIS